MQGENTVQSIERAMRILEELAGEKDGIGVTDLSCRVQLHKSTVHRILNTLLRLGYVEQNLYSEKYRLGTKLLYLGGAILDRMDIRRESHELLKQLAEEVNETVHLVIPDNDKALYVDKIDSNRTIRMYSQIGRRAPLHASAVGKAILAFSTPDYVEKIINNGLERYTKNTIVDPDKLIEHLKEIRVRGYAVDDEENEEGIRCVGAPVFDYTGKVIAAVSISGSTVTIPPERVPELASKVLDCARIISRKMGWRAGEM
ncbi:IclR family transcriptional regulator [Thermosediminibacter litoriperuensis]|uniref:Glycerol operon regulatory protein n=1 Tax=Thermosediminibacter litoriperuensis TaxID=291989 RepID=A0A5S5ANP7_9FIRM|nr:IclR family transcriptional regulator [Thermosediminibacter litoriperuensis]TYP53249.1 IclR family transcriptional regulator [Thermosediminibacter litoriperuensis]